MAPDVVEGPSPHQDASTDADEKFAAFDAKTTKTNVLVTEQLSELHQGLAAVSVNCDRIRFDMEEQHERLQQTSAAMHLQHQQDSGALLQHLAALEDRFLQVQLESQDERSRVTALLFDAKLETKPSPVEKTAEKAGTPRFKSNQKKF